MTQHSHVASTTEMEVQHVASDFLMGMIMVGFSSSSCQLVNMKICVSLIRKFPVDNHNLVSGGRWFHIRVLQHSIEAIFTST